MYLRKFVFARHIFVLTQSLQLESLLLAKERVVLNFLVFRTSSIILLDLCDLVSMTKFMSLSVFWTSYIAVKGLVGLGDRAGSDTCLSGLGQQLSAQCYWVSRSDLTP